MKKRSDEEFMHLFEQGSDEVDSYIDYSTGVSEYFPKINILPINEFQ